MDNGLVGLDHLVIGVRDLAAARSQWQRLGFTVTPRGRHVGWGTANHCIMFGTDYVELLGIADPSRFVNGLDRLLERREGPFALALGTGAAARTAEAWRAAGLHPAEPQRLGRVVELPTGPLELGFRNVMLPAESTAGLGLFACQHLTAERLRRPDWLAHANGALALVSCTLVAADPDGLAARLALIFGGEAVTRNPRVTVVRTGTAALLVASPAQAADLHPAFALGDGSEEPWPQVVAIMVEDPDRAAAGLARQGVAHRRDPSGAVLIAAAEATGVAIELVPG